MKMMMLLIDEKTGDVRTDIRTCSLLVFSKGTSLSFVHENVSEPLEIVKFVYPPEPTATSVAITIIKILTSYTVTTPSLAGRSIIDSTNQSIVSLG